MYISKRIHEFTWILVVQEQDFELGRRSLVVDCCPLYLIVDVVKLLLWNLLLALWRCYCYAVKFITHLPIIFRKANIRSRWTLNNWYSLFNLFRIEPLCSPTLILPSFIPDVDGEVTVCKLNSYYNEVRLEALNLNPKITHSNHRQVQAGNV